MIFLEPRTRDVWSIKERRVRAGRRLHEKCRLAYLSLLQCSDHHTAYPGCFRLAHHCVKNTVRRKSDFSGPGLPSGKHYGSILAPRAQAQQQHGVADGRGLVDSQLATLHRAVWEANQGLQIMGMLPRWGLQGGAHSHLARAACSWGGRRLQPPCTTALSSLPAPLSFQSMRDYLTCSQKEQQALPPPGSRQSCQVKTWRS